MNHVARKKETEAKLKNAVRIKLSELCKIETKKSSPDLFNFYAVSANHDLVTDKDSSTTCRSKIKAPSLKTNTKKERPSQNMRFI